MPIHKEVTRMGSGNYILVDGKPVLEPDVLKWSDWYCQSSDAWCTGTPNDRQIARDRIGGRLVSTVFLAIDHSFGGTPPLLYETIVFEDESGCGDDEVCERYETREQALAGHKRIVEELKAEIACGKVGLANIPRVG